ncbi:MAG: SMI1/KNR4 family protein [Polyangiaceae bacterium]|nr:SMI1/KNR4 family protein [Polyangiaceae bacterium]
MDIDLVEAVEKLKAILEKRSISYELGTASKELIEYTKKHVKLPSRYRSFLHACNPIKLESVTPVESVEFIPAENLIQEQIGFSLSEDLTPSDQTKDGSWRRNWLVIARSSLLGDPYFLDASRMDAEGDCPVMTAMSGTDRWEPRLAASSFVQFLQILAASMEVAEGFGEADVGVDDEDVFREALGPRIRPIDPAALRAGHWT